MCCWCGRDALGSLTLSRRLLRRAVWDDESFDDYVDRLSLEIEDLPSAQCEEVCDAVRFATLAEDDEKVTVTRYRSFMAAFLPLLHVLERRGGNIDDDDDDESDPDPDQDIAVKPTKKAKRRADAGKENKKKKKAAKAKSGKKKKNKK